MGRPFILPLSSLLICHQDEHRVLRRQCLYNRVSQYQNPSAVLCKLVWPSLKLKKPWSELAERADVSVLDSQFGINT